jgi:ribosomal protein S18 acetylase RimI-like enzyme
MVLIRRADARDARGIAHVHVESWRSTYAGIVPQTYLDNLNEWERAERWREMLTRDDELFVAERDGQIVAFAMGGASRDRVQDCDAELYAIYLLKDAQRARIGADLLRELARSLTRSGFRSMDVWVLQANPSKAFYQSTGAHYAASKEIEIGGAALTEEAYVWPDLNALTTLGIALSTASSLPLAE